MNNNLIDASDLVQELSGNSLGRLTVSDIRQRQANDSVLGYSTRQVKKRQKPKSMKQCHSRLDVAMFRTFDRLII